MNIKIIHNINEIDANQWDSCATDEQHGLNPFCSHGFLSALEDSGCVCAKTGWLPQHIIIENNDNLIIGVMPLYLKSHSQGEYVFDHGWANAYEQAGGRYYPKLQCSIPFSPVNGPRLLANDLETKKILLEAAIAHGEKCGVSSLHFTFIENDELEIMASRNLLTRQDQQFHWLNNNYKSFNQFLDALSSRKRKNITKERRLSVQDGIEIEHIKFQNIKEYHWDYYFEFYIDTSNRKWGSAYLNREFFTLLSERIPQNLLLIMAKRNGKYIAGALNLIGQDTLFGRYWGATEHHKFLHFEVCYYQAIEYAIKNGLSKVEAGAQGDHKIARGYVPIATNSAHWIENASFRNAIESYLIKEKEAVSQNIKYLSGFVPFKKT